MLWSFESLRGYGLRATDGTIGDVHDMLFDDRSWTVRYLVADTSRWLFGRRVLIAAAALGQPDARAREFAISLSKEQIRTSPDIDADKPVSRQMEEDLHAHYDWAPYWGSPLGLTVGGPVPPPPLAGTAATGERGQDTDRGDPHLRSMREVEGYDIAAADGSIGHVENILIDPAGWRIRYLVIETSKWLPGNFVIIAPDWATRIAWDGREVHVDLTREQVENSPPFIPNKDVERAYEQRLYGYYGRVPYWV